MKRKPIIPSLSTLIAFTVIFSGCETIYQNKRSQEFLSFMQDYIVPWVDKWFYRCIAVLWFCFKLFIPLVTFIFLIGVSIRILLALFEPSDKDE